MADSPKSERHHEMHGLQPQDIVSRTLQTAANSEAMLRLRRLPMTTGGWGNITVIGKPLSSNKLTRYTITNDNGVIRCNCPAAQFGKSCRHMKSDRISAYKAVVDIVPAIIARAEARVKRRQEILKNKQKPVDNLAVIW